ncbi:leucine-rich repeat and WD repeat-containing protein 1 [Electrophorus electricus]|uniref:leucine-rich repeat and WD repeat-containing protein 1 n=1 Tax=Electrophorus electricus TaxID=8005 RepID=UPI0015CFA627|nr:leucine-rich repeat and WD repeat-containing protein 1 [Electrophorus electricus]
MAKITESILLEKGLPKTNKLDQVKSLNLSRMSLKKQDLPVPLLCKLSSLEQLDLSGNMLQELPAGLYLPSLRLLDCSNNNMEDVTSLEALDNLEELRVEDNLYLTVNDEHKVIFLLPRLRRFNGKDIRVMADHIHCVNDEILKKRVIALWEKDFSLPSPLTTQSLSTVEKKFVNAACFQVKYGPSSLNEYTKWRVAMIAKEYLKSLTDPLMEVDNNSPGTPVAEEEDELRLSNRVNLPAHIVTQSPFKKKRSEPLASEVESPRKRRALSGEPAAAAGPRRSIRLAAASPIEAVPRNTSQNSPTNLASPRGSKRTIRETASEESPRTRSCPQTTQQKAAKVHVGPRKAVPAPGSLSARGGTSETPKKNQKEKPTAQKGKCAYTPTKAENGTPKKTITYQVPQEPACLQPLHVLQCHSRQDSPEDFSTQLWACAFEPQQQSGDSSGWTQTVATCGGESICVIDCESGHVLKKYKVPGEMFYTLAWTTVLMSREGTCVRPCSVLAAGGTRGVVRLIHPRANLAYGKFRVGRRPISILRFCPRRGNFLFTGTYDKKIVMWDIGGLDRDYNFKTSQLLVLQTGSTPLHLCLPPSSPDTHLLAGCDSGLYSFDIQLSKNTQKRTDEMEIVFTSYKESKTNDCHTIDGLSFLTDDVVASKSPTQGSIYLWSWSGTRASQRGQQKEVPAQILAELQWSSTDIPYLSLNTCPSFGYVVCGDEDGRLWTYHISDSVTATFKTGKVPATEVLKWPCPIRAQGGQVEGTSINSVAMDPELHYLVALSDKNMVVIWKRAMN